MCRGGLLLIFSGFLAIGCVDQDKSERDFAFLQKRYSFEARAPGQPAWLTAAEAEEDLRELGAILEERFAYLHWLGVDYAKALESTRAGLADGIETGDLALQLQKLLALFGDGHTQVPSLSDYFPAVYLPIALGDAREGMVAYQADGSGLLDDDYPILKFIDGATVEELIRATSVLVQRGSPQLVRRRSLGLTRHAPFWRRELGLPDHEKAVLTLSSLDGAKERIIEVDLVGDEAPVAWHWLDDSRFPHAEYRILDGDVGYLRIRRMAADSGFVALLHEAMGRFQTTSGLIIDVRGNGGGDRAALVHLFPYLMPPGSNPRISNVAKYRLTLEDTIGDPEGYLDNRFLFPATSSRYGAAERGAIEELAETFRPAWVPPQDSFSDWHYLILTAKDTTPYYHYDRSVVVLQDEACFSATDIFLSGFKGWPGVTLMGMASSGGSGRTRSFVLSNSRIPLRISSMASYLVDGRLMDGAGVTPDIELKPSFRDLAGETDTVLQAALSLIGSGRVGGAG